VVDGPSTTLFGGGWDIDHVADPAWVGVRDLA
jgi:hypothetical protein